MANMMILCLKFVFPIGISCRAGETAGDILNPLCREPVLLHDRGADPRAVLQVRGCQADHHGPRQIHPDTLRVLLHRVCSPSKLVFKAIY